MPDLLLATATAAAVGGTVTATVNGVVTTVNVARGLTVASGDVLVVGKTGSRWWATAIAFDLAPQPPNNGAPPPTGGTTGVLPVAPVETRTYRGGRWRTDNSSVYQGDWSGTGNNTGCVFFGAAPRSLAGATVTSATVQVRRLDGGNFAAHATTMRLMTQATRPAGAPTLTSSTTGPSLAVNATSTAFAVPAAWVQAMVAGTAGGIAFLDSATQAAYARFAGLGDWAAAFALSIHWSR